MRNSFQASKVLVEFRGDAIACIRLGGEAGIAGGALQSGKKARKGSANLHLPPCGGGIRWGGVSESKHPHPNPPPSRGREPCCERLRADLARYLAGEKVSFLRYQVDLSGLPEFSRQVLAAARRIPYGECCTYGELAEAVGRPKAARAVGQALRRNPAPIVIPCHRVVGKHGDLVGFSAGLEWKKYLLALERESSVRE